MIIHIDNTYIKEYEKDTVINDLCQGKRLNLVVKKIFFFSLVQNPVGICWKCIENKGFMVGYCKHKRGNFPSYLQIAIWIPTFLKAF